MRLPIDTKGLTMLATAAERAVNRATGEPVADRETGAAVWTVHVTVTQSGEARPELWAVRLAGSEPKVAMPAVVNFSGLVANTWEFNNKHGVQFRAENMDGTPIAPPAANGSTPAKAGATS